MVSIGARLGEKRRALKRGRENAGKRGVAGTVTIIDPALKAPRGALWERSERIFDLPLEIEC